MYVLSSILLLAGALCALGNWIGTVQWYTRQRRTSLIPLIGGLLGFMGCVVYPNLPWTWGFLALALDPWWLSLTGIPYLVAIALNTVRKRQSRSEKG